MAGTTSTPRTPLTRVRVLWALLLLGAAALGCASATWITTEVATAVRPTELVTATGNEAAPVVSAAALVLLACGPTLALTGRVGRYVVLAVAALAGVGVLAGVFTVVGDRDTAGRAAAADAVGVTELTAPVELTAWPWTTAVAGALAVAVALVAGFAARRWPEVSRRHERDGTVGTPTGHDGVTDDDGTASGRGTPEPDPAADWDALSRGEDPTREDG